MDTVAIIIVPGASNLDFYNLKHLRKQLTYENQDILPINPAKRGPVIRKSWKLLKFLSFHGRKPPIVEFFQINYFILFCSPIDKLYNGINIFAIQQKLGTQCQKNFFSGHHPAGRTMKNFKWTSELQFLPYHIFKYHFSFVFISKIQLISYKKWKKLLEDDQKCQFS